MRIRHRRKQDHTALQGTAPAPWSGPAGGQFIPALWVSLLLAAAPASAAQPAGDADRGAKAFRACAACHALQPGRHMTGPTLHGVLGRKAGAAQGFNRYSDALRRSDIVWSEDTLDQWLADPRKLVPGNEMAFPGIPDARARRDLVAYPKAVDEGRKAPPGPRMPDLGNARADQVVKSIRHCGDTYVLTSETGDKVRMWEFNLRFKTDSSEYGPRPGRPVLVGAGMRGDRASVVFSAPGEISRLIRTGC